MDEASKTRLIWGEFEKKILTGNGIDIGCGPDPVTPDCERFDIADGDANQISTYVKKQFDFVFSSHCLEHMHDPHAALLDWWKLVKTGGYIFFLVPDEDLYEQGVFPSRFNPDHKATFTLSKYSSWSSKSINVLDLALSLPNSKLVSLHLQDKNYDRSLHVHGPTGSELTSSANNTIANRIRRRLARCLISLPQERKPVDQTSGTALAQIQCIVQKTV